jgi:hypothetical protein
VLSSTPGSGDIRNKFHDVEVGVVNWEEALGRTTGQGEMGITTGNRQKYTLSEIEIEEISHPVTAPFDPGTFQIFENAVESWGSQWGLDLDSTDPLEDGLLAPGAVILANISRETSEDGGFAFRNAAIVAVDTGDEIWEAAGEPIPAPGRRLMFPTTDNSASELTEDGWILLKRSIEWTGGVLEAATDPALLGHWPLTEGEGEELNDAAGKNDAAEFVDGEWIAAADGANVPSFLSAASVPSFDGSATFALLAEDIFPVLDDDTPFSIAFFSNQAGDGTGVNNIVLGNRYDTEGVDFAPREFVKFTPTKFEFHEDGNGNQNVAYDEPIPSDEWTHHAIVKDGLLFTYYRNGEEVNSREYDSETYPLNPLPLFIGGQQPGAGGENWSGAAADVGLWSRPLSAAEVATVATSGIGSLNPTNTVTGPIFAPEDPIKGGQLSADGTQFVLGVAGTEADINNWPEGEAPENSINATAQKYLNFGKLNTGFLITPAVGESVANQLKLWTANDEPPRDPATFAIYGSNEEIGDEGPFDLSNFKMIVASDLSLPDTRNDTDELLEENSQAIVFGNSSKYNSYLVIFPTVKNSETANSMQIADVQLSNIGNVQLLTVARVKSTSIGLTFEVTNADGSVLDKVSLKVTVDDVEVETTVEDIDGGFMVTYTADPGWLPGSSHTYSITAKDMNGGIANRSGAGETQVKDALMPFNTPLVGPEGTDGMWAVRYIWGAGTISTSTTAIDIIQRADDPDFEGQIFDTMSTTANLNDAARWSEWDDYPDEVLDAGGGTEDFIVSYKGTLRITEAGVYTFGVNTDDGMGLRIFGAEFTSLTGAGSQIDEVQPSAVVFTGTSGNTNTHAVVTLAVGNYPIEFFWFERGGGDKGVLYFAKGDHGSFEDLEEGETLGEDNWVLVGGEHLVGPATLPFQIIDLVKMGSTVTITWESKENVEYVIGKSTDLVDFLELTDGWPSEGPETSYTDEDATETEVYYRIRQDG